MARPLADRLGLIGTNLGNTRWQRAAHASVAISGLLTSRRLPQQVLHRVRDTAEMDSACLVFDEPEGQRTVTAVGPLADSMSALAADDLVALSSLVGDIRSCYTAGDASSPGFVGTESLRAAGARAVVVRLTIGPFPLSGPAWVSPAGEKARRSRVCGLPLVVDVSPTVVGQMPEGTGGPDRARGLTGDLPAWLRACAGAKSVKLSVSATGH